jgi:hypothetical protein
MNDDQKIEYTYQKWGGQISKEELRRGLVTNSAIKEVEENPSDRATGIVYGSIIEDSLKRCILRFVSDPKLQKIVQESTSRVGPFAAFDTKINLGAMIGIYGTEAHRALMTIKDIRNKFAHLLEATGFDCDAVRDLVKNLKFADRHIRKHDSGFRVDFRINSLNNPTLVMSDHEDNPIGTPRTRYTFTCWMLLNLIDNATPASEQRPTAF